MTTLYLRVPVELVWLGYTRLALFNWKRDITVKCKIQCSLGCFLVFRVSTHSSGAVQRPDCEYEVTCVFL